MSRKDFWTEKLAQAFHDPFWKAWCQGKVANELARWLGGMVDADIPDGLVERHAQDKIAMLLAQRMLGTELVIPGKWWVRKDLSELAEALEAGQLVAPVMADWAATGADRPVLGTSRQVHVFLWKPGRDHVVVTHPLARAPVHVPTPSTLEGLKEKLAPSLTLLDDYRRALDGVPEEDRHHWAFLYTWRRLPEDLAQQEGIWWPLQPADTRCPDHSIWDHLRVTSALAFLPKTKTPDETVRGHNKERRPWLLSMWVGPVREFVGQARTGRDLWTGSTMLAELAWAMIEPIAEALGPDAIVYPDLRANPRADRWLAENYRGLLSGDPASSRASLIPNRFVAVVPEGTVSGGGLHALAKAAQEAVDARWQEMAQAVQTYLKEDGRLGPGPWEEIYEKQVAVGPTVRWAAVPWVWDGSKEIRKIRRSDIQLPPLFPFEKDPTSLPEPIQQIERARRERLEEWVSQGIFTHYQAARWTYLQTHPGYLLGQRGFDYALYHHCLLAALSGRKLLGDRKEEGPEPGEKCSLCGARQALTNEPEGSVSRQRQAARELWRHMDPEGLGAERLCGPCAVRRYLTDTKDSIKKNWEATLHDSETRGSHRVPFPATDLVAGQRWLVSLCDAYERDRSLRQAVEEFNSASAAAELGRTQFAGSVIRVRRKLHAGLDENLRELLKIGVQYIDPSVWERLERAGDKPAACRRARQAAGAIRTKLGSPATHLAVVVLDGDRMGELLLGSADRVKAKWREVLHPETVRQLLDHKSKKSRRNGTSWTWKDAWLSTLESSRLMGPSVHAFVSRALRHFSNRILPWVVEREYGGRLIYAGGDDALILCPADEALPMLSRLDELFTAPWVLDYHPEASTWVAEERPEPLYDVGSRQARARFQVIASEHDLVDSNLSNARIVPMLGPHSSFSAGAAFGHFKTSLRVLRAEARRLQEEAKRLGGRRAGLAWYTRSGVKARAIVPLDKTAPGNVAQIQEIAMGFKQARIPRRLPYKLREAAPIAREALKLGDGVDEELSTDRILEGLVANALDTNKEAVPFIARLWRIGFAAEKQTGPQEEGPVEGTKTQPTEPQPKGPTWDGLGPLLFARALSSHLGDQAHSEGAES